MTPPSTDVDLLVRRLIDELHIGFSHVPDTAHSHCGPDGVRRVWLCATGEWRMGTKLKSDIDWNIRHAPAHVGLGTGIVLDKPAGALLHGCLTAYIVRGDQHLYITGKMGKRRKYSSITVVAQTG